MISQTPMENHTPIQFLLVLFTIMLLVGCAHKPPEGAVPGRISINSLNNTPYQTSWINHYVPRGINDYAHYPIVDESRDAPYVLNINILSSNSNIVGFTPSYSGTNVVYRVRIEYQVAFSDMDGKIVWTHTGWAEHNSESNAIYVMAKIIGREMANAGLLKPSYFTIRH